MQNYGWNVTPFEANGQFKIVDVFSRALDKFKESNSTSAEDQIEFNVANLAQMKYHQSLYDVEMLSREGMKFFTLRSILAHRKQFRLVVFDSISPLLLTNDESIFQMIHTLKLGTRVTQTSGIAILNSDAHDNATIGLMNSLADTIIELKNVEKGEYSAIIFQKYIGVNKTIPFPIERSERGITIIPIAMPELANSYVPV
jgi:archaellum biogenesis ATPase FlaH